MKGEARHIRMWLPDFLPLPLPQKFTADRTGGILHNFDAMFGGNCKNCF